MAVRIKPKFDVAKAEKKFARREKVRSAVGKVAGTLGGALIGGAIGATQVPKRNSGLQKGMSAAVGTMAGALAGKAIGAVAGKLNSKDGPSYAARKERFMEKQQGKALKKTIRKLGK